MLSSSVAIKCRNADKFDDKVQLCTADLQGLPGVRMCIEANQQLSGNNDILREWTGF